MDSSHAVQHGELIAKAAKSHLSPIGMKRKGKSRVWLKDNRWWLAVVEFQPSAWSKGTYLNVAVAWLWHAQDYLSFDEVERVGGFADFTEPPSFAMAADEYASRAATEVLSISGLFPTLHSVATHLRAKADGNPWHHYNAMMASLANGELAHARVQHDTLRRLEHDASWCSDLQVKARTFMIQATDQEAALAVVSKEVAAARKLLRLAELTDESLWQVAL